MLAASDLIHLPFTSSLTESGIAYACRYLACKMDHQGIPSLKQLQCIVSEVATDLAFRRYLYDQNIHFDIYNEVPFTHPDCYYIYLGGHRCIIKNFLISRRSQITQIRREPGILLQKSALLSFDEFASEGRRADDLYIFAFLLGLVTTSQEDIKKASDAGQAVYLFHPLPEEWARPSNWSILGELALKSECRVPITLEIGGQDSGRNFSTAKFELPPGQRVASQPTFYNLAYIYAKQMPDARIGIHCPNIGKPHIIPAYAWGNLWIYGMDIYLAGWMTREDFHQNSSAAYTGTHNYLFEKTSEKSRQIPLTGLNPIEKLLDLVRHWQAR